MQTEINKSKYQLPITNYLAAGGIAALIAIVLNNIYHLSYTEITGVSVVEVINVASVSIVTFVTLMLASLVYYALDRNTNKATTIFIVLAIFLTICSMGTMAIPIFPNRDEVPEGFYGLSLPMHFIAGIVAAVVIPAYIAYKEGKAKEHEHA
ncbi:cytochrome bd-type quinol oxidase subunit 2 [Catalinimonas alkaloidigena]|uniref:DUF6069 family protein n=1 Tax=Catalinimonas alkaloidigena TaxID=1075417 RepID=UPI002407496C|nr:DUF6069 family protein [Catalinimonas alkaloidigena]MDF9797099.1 cytochrome bd-type quinol oxidase subunit 2 [Catalinimonas alkaloidigena]